MFFWSKNSEIKIQAEDWLIEWNLCRLKKRMIAVNKNCRNKKAGWILLELNFLFMILILVSGIYCNVTHLIFNNCKKILADIEIARSARYTENVLTRELSFNSSSVRVSKDLNNRDQIICRKTSKNVRAFWYLSNFVLYRKTVKDSAMGTNPFSNPEIQVTNWHVFVLGEKKLGIIMTLRHKETGLMRNKSFTILLSNSLVTS